MISQGSINGSFSKMSLAVAKDSGWYVVDMQKGDKYIWGKNKGCQIFDRTCSPNLSSIFCSDVEGISCSDDHLYVNTCLESVNRENCYTKKNLISCKIPQNTLYTIYNYGYDSMCHPLEVIITFLSNFR